MRRYVVSRIAQAAIIVAGISVAVFLVLRVTAGDPARIRSPVFASPDVIDAYRREFGTDLPILTQLSTFVSRAIRGDFGESFRFQVPVADLIRQALPRTLALAGLALLISLLIAVLLGSTAARRPGSLWDKGSTVIATFGQSAPVFAVGLVLVLVFSVTLGWLPAGGYDGFRSLILPAIAVSLSILPTQLRVMRAEMKATFNEDYIRSARAYGLSERQVTYGYALRNASLPLFTVVGVDMGYLLGGVIVAEIVFNFPGVGQLALVALNARDFPLIQGITIVTASIFVGLNLGVDLLYPIIDPRLRRTNA